MTQQIPERIPGGAVDLSHLAARAAAGQPGAAGPGAGPGASQGQVVDVPSLVLDVTDQTFEQAAQLSAIVPVVVDLWAEWCQPCKTLGPVLEKVTREFGGRVLLIKVDVDANPGLAQAFQAQSIPTVVALVGGRPLPLFQGAIPEAQVREVFTQLVQLAEQQGVVGRLNAPEAGEEESGEPAEPPVNPAHAEALEALERGDYAAAVEAYEQVLLKAPADAEAHAALVQVRLLARLQGASADEIRTAAAADPADIDAQLRVADLDVSGGHVEDAFLRLLDLFAGTAEEERRTEIRERLLELFEVVGVSDPRVAAARGRLANLLY
ncbi:MAG: co-chaperone YbbN [Candidatus Leucobacter sulfamidivorax]|nr:co-chaperone YbbN [Candidatus Leucobacter sulfamidivorax]